MTRTWIRPALSRLGIAGAAALLLIVGGCGGTARQAPANPPAGTSSSSAGQGSTSGAAGQASTSGAPKAGTSTGKSSTAGSASTGGTTGRSSTPAGGTAGNTKGSTTGGSSTTGSSSTPSTTGAAGTAAGLSASTLAGYYKPNGSATAEAGQALKISMTEFKFTPNTITATHGQPVNIALTNAGSVTHNLSLPAFHVNVTLPPGHSATVNFTPDKTGTFYFYCDTPGHVQAGMVGKLTVK